MSFRTLIRLPALRQAAPARAPACRAIASARGLHTTLITRTTAGYGDPQSEKIENHTPTPNKDGKPSSQPDPNPGSEGKQPGQKSGTTDPEVAKGSSSSSSSSKKSTSSSGKGKVGNAGGKKGAGNKAEEKVTETEIKETKKIGSEPKNEEVGGAGPIGG